MPAAMLAFEHRFGRSPEPIERIAVAFIKFEVHVQLRLSAKAADATARAHAHDKSPRSLTKAS